MFEIKYFRIQDHATIKASFTVAFQKLELNDCKLVQGKDGLFFSPPSRKYEKDGNTKYANFFWISDETLRKAIETAALEQVAKEQAKAQQAANMAQQCAPMGDTSGFADPPPFDDADSIPF